MRPRVEGKINNDSQLHTAMYNVGEKCKKKKKEREIRFSNI